MLKRLKILVLSILLLCASSIIIAQDNLLSKVDISFQHGTIQEYLDTMQHQLDAVFVYSDIIHPQAVVSIPEGRYSVKHVLDSLFKEQSVLYVSRNNLIILSPQTKSNINNERIVISGKVVSQKNIQIPFATIYIEYKSLGTIANAEGVFRFVLPTECSSDTLSISSLGYESVRISPNEYLTKNLEVRLKTSRIAIKDVIVRPEKPGNLVTASFNSIKDNYSNKHVIMNAFFRESSMQDNDYISLSEALIEIKKSSYTSGLNDLIRLVKGRNGTNISQSELVNLVVQGGLYNGLRLDVAKYGSYFYDENSQAECDYKMLRTIFFQDRLTYVIGFNSKEGVNYSGYEGKLYIDSESLALVRAEFNLSEQGIKYARSVLVKKTPKGFKAKPIYAKYEVEYRFYNNVWNLHYARSDFGIKVKKVRGKKNKGFSCNFISTSEFVVTGITNNPTKRIPFRATSKPNDVLVEQVKNTESTFWLNDNIILPEEPLLSTIQKLQLQGERPKEESIISKDD